MPRPLKQLAPAPGGGRPRMGWGTPQNRPRATPWSGTGTEHHAAWGTLWNRPGTGRCAVRGTPWNRPSREQARDTPRNGPGQGTTRRAGPAQVSFSHSVYYSGTYSPSAAWCPAVPVAAHAPAQKSSQSNPTGHTEGKQRQGGGDLPLLLRQAVTQLAPAPHMAGCWSPVYSQSFFRLQPLSAWRCRMDQS